MSGFKVGDKVGIIGHVWEPEHGRIGVIVKANNDGTYLVSRKDGDLWGYSEESLLLIEEESEMKLWRDMTPEEKGALLLAHHENKRIEYNEGDGWQDTYDPCWCESTAYRVKSKPVVEVVRFDSAPFNCGWHKFTFNLVDGKPDVTSIKMEKL